MWAFSCSPKILPIETNAKLAIQSKDRNKKLLGEGSSDLYKCAYPFRIPDFYFPLKNPEANTSLGILIGWRDIRLSTSLCPVLFLAPFFPEFWRVYCKN